MRGLYYSASKHGLDPSPKVAPMLDALMAPIIELKEVLWKAACITRNAPRATSLCSTTFSIRPWVIWLELFPLIDMHAGLDGVDCLSEHCPEDAFLSVFLRFLICLTFIIMGRNGLAWLHGRPGFDIYTTRAVRSMFITLVCILEPTWILGFEWFFCWQIWFQL